MEDTGLRITETLNVVKKDIDFRTNILTVTHPKTEKRCKCSRWKNKNEYSKSQILDYANPNCEVCNGKGKWKKPKAKEKIPILLEQVSTQSSNAVIDEIEINVNAIKSYFTNSKQYDEFFHMSLGKKLVKENPNSVYIGIFESGPTIRIIVYSGDEASKNKNAGNIAKSVAEILGGAGGGDAKFAQGGGKDTSKINDAITKAKSMILG